MVVRHRQNHSQGLLNDPDCAPEFAKSVFTSRTGSHARDGIVTLRKNPFTISSLVLLFILISQVPTKELRVPRNASKSITIQLRCPRMH